MLLVPNFISGPASSVYNNATSTKAQMAYIQTILAVIFSLLLLGFACVAYIGFYFQYIPQIGLETAVHLIYGSATSLPYGASNISSGVLMHNQPYDVYISLVLPTSPRNFEAGAFMINLTLFDGDLETPAALSTSKRAASLTYKSDIIYTMDTLMRSPLYLSGLRREQETLDVLMMEGVVFGKNRVPKYIGVRIGTDTRKAPEAYESKIVFKARFRGLRYFMYNYRIIAFITFVSAFWVTELLWASISWAIISSWSSGSEETPEKRSQRVLDNKERPAGRPSPASTETDRARIHPLAPVEDDSEEIPRPRGIYATPEPTPAPEGEEGDDEEDSEDYSNGRSDEGGRTPTSMDEATMHGSAQDSGIGTSMSENRESTGLVRRRSGRRND